jgi:hypothetical protein
MLTTLILAAGFAAAAAAPKAPGASDYAGRWNLRITDATDTFVSGGLRIDDKAGALSAGLVWRWGSYLPAKSVEVQDGALRLTREDTPGKLDVFEARLEGDTLEGQVTYADGTIQHFEGRRAPSLLGERPPVWDKPVPLFDGRSLAGWRLRDPKKPNGWAARDGELVVVEPKGNSDLVSETSFRNFKLHLEFNVDAMSNSGVYLRGRYEIQILDNAEARSPLDVLACGSLYSRVSPERDAAKPAGEWQSYDISFVGRKLQVILNGQPILDTLVDGITGGALDPFEGGPGPLMLQGDHGKVRFRNILVTPAR